MGRFWSLFLVLFLFLCFFFDKGELIVFYHNTEHPDTLWAMENLAVTYWYTGRWKKAVELQLQVTDGRLKVLGVEHPDTLFSMRDLMLMYGWT